MSDYTVFSTTEFPGVMIHTIVHEDGTVSDYLIYQVMRGWYA